MKVLFISNFFNHHQKPFSDAMFDKLGDGYSFIETSEISAERKSLGWGMEEKPSYVVSREQLVRERDRYQKLIDEADAVIIGSAPNDLIKNRIKSKKIIFRYSERPLKNGQEIWKFPYRYIKWNIMNPNRANVYLLCASAYTAPDYAQFGLFKNKAYKWGYFPETRRYDDIERVIEEKNPNSILWVARFLVLKHPEVPIEIARRLQNDGYTFLLNLIGNGVLEEKIGQMITDLGLSDCVHMLGSMKPNEVRDHMERSEIFLFTSDRHEGWGAVLNESMNSGCAVVASHAIGSVPFLLNDGENGFIYKDGDIDNLYKKVKLLLDDSCRRREMSKKAYFTIADEWNAENAATRFIYLLQDIKENGNSSRFSHGPCSKS